MPAGNRIPLFGPKMGCRFPLDPLRETASHFKGINRDVVSPNGTFGKPHPTLDAQNGMSFPMVGSAHSRGVRSKGGPSPRIVSA